MGTGIMLPAPLVLAQDLAAALDAFRGEHRGCGDLDGGVDDAAGDAYIVRLSCSGCGAGLRRRFER